MLKKILKWFLGDYNKRIAKSMSAFTKIIDKATKLNEEMRADIYKKEAKIAELNANINDINASIDRNMKFITNVQKLTE